MCAATKGIENKVAEGKEGGGGGEQLLCVVAPPKTSGQAQVIENAHGAYIIHNEETARKAPSGSGLRAIRAMRRKG